MQQRGDGLRHFAYQNERRFYNGVTLDDIFDESKDNILGIHNASNRGIVGRGVLVDYHAWRLEHRPDIAYAPWQSNAIPLEHLKSALEAQGTDLKFGDILIIRTGYIDAYKTVDKAALAEYSKVVPPNLTGVEASEEMMEWIWSNFSAVAGDQPAFEATRECHSGFSSQGQDRRLHASQPWPRLASACRARCMRSSFQDGGCPLARCLTLRH